MNSFILGAYWSARQESTEQCADRMLKFLKDLTSCDSSMAQWFKLGRSKKEALRHQVNVQDRKTLLTLLERGRHVTDVSKEIMHDLGFSVWLWNGGDTPTASQLSVTCGGYSGLIPNSVVIRLPRDLGALSTVDKMRGVLAAAAKAWEPEWAGILSQDARELRQTNMHEPFVDWMLYLCGQWLPDVPSLTAPASVERCGSGTLVIVQNEPPDPLNPNHVENIRRVETALRAAWQVPHKD